MGPRPAWLLAFSLLSASCTTTFDQVGDGSEEVVLPAEDLAIERDLQSGVPPEFVPALEAVRVALSEGDELNARRALQRVLARQPEGRTLELARGFERILDGRERIRWLDWRLEAAERPGQPGSYDLVLVASQQGPEALVLRSGGARLRVTQYAVDPDGHERRGSRRDAVPFPSELVLPIEGELRLPIADLSLEPPTGVLAFSSIFDFELLPGEFVDGGRYLPVQSVPVESLEIVRLAGELSGAPLDPGELVAYVDRGRIFVPALMERAVRILPDQRPAALDGLAPVAERLNIVELELLVPALRWLSGSVVPGGDPEAWRRWLRERAARRAVDEVPPRERLLLPR